MPRSEATFDVDAPYCFSCSIAARILGTTSGQKRFATASNRVAIARVHLTAMGSGLKTSLPKRLPASSAADSAEPAAAYGVYEVPST